MLLDYKNIKFIIKLLSICMITLYLWQFAKSLGYQKKKNVSGINVNNVIMLIVPIGRLNDEF